MLVLTPAVSSEERENRSPSFWKERAAGFAERSLWACAKKRDAGGAKEAMAHKLARILWRLIKYKEPYQGGALRPGEG